MTSEHARSLTSAFRPWLQSASISATAPLAAALTTRHASPILFIILAPLEIVVPRRGSESHVRHWWYLGHAIALMEINGCRPSTQDQMAAVQWPSSRNA